MIRVLFRWPAFLAVLAAGATLGAAWAWWWAASAEHDICTDNEPEEG